MRGFDHVGLKVRDWISKSEGQRAGQGPSLRGGHGCAAPGLGVGGLSHHTPSSHLLLQPLYCGGESRLLHVLSSVPHSLRPVSPSLGYIALGFHYDALARFRNVDEIEVKPPFGASKVLGG